MVKTKSHSLLLRLLKSDDAMRNANAQMSTSGPYFDGRMSVQQASTFHPLGAGSQQPAAADVSSCNYSLLGTSQQSSFMQNGTPLPSNGLKVIHQCNFYQDSQFIHSHPPQLSLQKPNSEYSQQNVASHWKPQVTDQQAWMQYQSPNASMHKHSVILQNSDSGMKTKPSESSGTTATTTSLPHQQRLYTGQYGFPFPHNNRVIYKRLNKNNDTQQSYLHRLQSYNTKFRQTRRDNHIDNMPSHQGVQVSQVGQRSQQHPAQLSPIFHSKEVNNKIEDEILRIADDLRNSYPLNQDVCAPSNNSSQYRGVQSNFSNQPVATNTSNTGQSSVFSPREALCEHCPIISSTQSAASSLQKSHCVVLNLLMVDQNNSLGKESGNSQTPKPDVDCSVNSPPGRTNSKAVAVVQPLSQQSSQVYSNLEVFDADGCKPAAISPCNPPTEVSEKTVCAQDLGSTPAGKMLVDQNDAQQTLGPDAPTSKISSDLTVTWTIKELQQLIRAEEKAQQKCTDLPDDMRSKVHRLFIKNVRALESRKNVLCFLRECKIFLKSHIMSDTVITQLKPGFENTLEHYHVLRDNHLYSEPPFRSLWLNVNDQLDDIDKEFGFPPCLRYPCRSTTNSQPSLVATADVTPDKTVTESSHKDFSLVEPKSVESEVEAQVEPKLVESEMEAQSPSVECSPVQAASDDDMEDGNSPNPYYSFEIQILPPDEAKLIYEQTESLEQPSEAACVQSRDLEHQPEEDVSSSVSSGGCPRLDITLLNGTEVTLDSPVEEVCCFSRLVENIFEPNLLQDKCQCGEKQSIIAVVNLTDGDPSGGSTPAHSVTIHSISSTGSDDEVENPDDSHINISSHASEGEEKNLCDVSSDSVEHEQQTPVIRTVAPVPDVDLTRKSENEPRGHAGSSLPDKSQLSADLEVSGNTSVRRQSKSKAAQLVLYGSEQNPVNPSKRKRCFSSEGAVCAMLMPPEVLSVPLRSLKRRLSEPLPAPEQSVKSKIFDIWKKSFPVTPLKGRRKNPHKCATSPGAKEKPQESPERNLKSKSLKSKPRPKDGAKHRMVTSPGELRCSHLSE